MRAFTKYGSGTLVGVSMSDGIVSFKVLIDHDCIEQPCEKRLYNCLSADFVTEEGEKIHLVPEKRE